MNLVTTLLAAHCVFLTALLVVLDVHALFVAETDHTGLPISWLSYLFAGSGFVAVMLLSRGRNLPGSRLAWILFVLCVIGISNIVALERFNILMEYDVWGRKGLPAKRLGASDR